MTATLRTTADVGRREAATRTRGRLVVAQLTLLGVDVVGGLLAVTAGVNTWSEAWGPAALLAAPLPMMVGQAVLVLLAVSTPRRWGAIPAGLLALACFVSIASGFFDGGIGNACLTGWLTAYQALLLVVTGIVGLLALLRARDLLRGVTTTP